MGGRIEDLEAIAAVVQLYVDGSAEGDIAKLKEAFHEDARMFGGIGDQRYDAPIQAYIDMAAAQPTGGHQAHIISIDQVGDAAVAVLAEEGFWGMSFVDYFSLARQDGQWKIVNKTFAHTGGNPPPAS